MPRVYEIIKKKREGASLTRSEVKEIVQAPDPELVAFLMSVWFCGLNMDETTGLTEAMIESGATLDLSQIAGPKVDKHSTGGVGDKASLILAPLIAACDVCVPMVSGRALGHTGGTVDKLESIPGFRTNLSVKEVERNLSTVGVCISGQTEELVPADKRMYGLRSRTATVDSIPLICASICSKKFAEDLDGLILDVKFGSGAFMKDIEKARELANLMVEVGTLMGERVIALITRMDTPLGRGVGTSVEVNEAIQVLQGKEIPSDLLELVYSLGEKMLGVAGIHANLRKKMESGRAYEKFIELVKAQGGELEQFRVPEVKIPVFSKKEGYVVSMDTESIGWLSHRAQINFVKKTGDEVKTGDLLAWVFTKDIETANELMGYYAIGEKEQTQESVIIEEIES